MVAPCPQFAHKPPAGSEIFDRLQIAKYAPGGMGQGNPHNINHPSADISSVGG